MHSREEKNAGWNYLPPLKNRKEKREKRKEKRENRK
jgi:hypothetical protein